MRLDPETGQWENLGSFNDPSSGKRLGVYGIPADRDNNLYLLDFQSSNIGRIEAKTGQFTVYRGQIANSRPRRGAVDDQNRLWFAEYAGNAVGMLDPQTKQIKEWVLPTPWTQPYDVVLDKNGEAWTGSMMSDRVSRLDPRPVGCRVSTAQDDQHPPRVRGQLDSAGDVLDRQQPWRIDRQGRAAGLGEPILAQPIKFELARPRARSDKVDLHFRRCASECALVSLRLSHFLRKTRCPLFREMLLALDIDRA